MNYKKFFWNFIGGITPTKPGVSRPKGKRLPPTGWVKFNGFSREVAAN